LVACPLLEGDHLWLFRLFLEETQKHYEAQRGLEQSHEAVV
jgi:hypothetical protein